MAGAQAIILKELNKEFGNSAQGAGKTMAGALAILHNNLSIVEEKIGNAVIPVFTQLVTAAMPLVGIIGTGLADAFDVVGGWLKQIGPLFSQVSLTVGPFAGILSNLEAHADGIGSTFMNQVVPALEAFIPSGNQISGIVTDLQNDFNQLAPIVANIAAAIMDGLNQALGTLAPLISTLGGLFTGTIIPAFIALLPHIINLYDGVAQILPPVLSLANAILSVAVGIATGLAPVLQVLIPILTQLYGWIADQVGAALKAMAPVVQQASDGVNKFSGQLSEKLEPAMKRVGAAIQTMVAFIQPLWNAVWPGMEEVFAGVWSIIQGIIQIAWSILSNTFLFWLDIISGNWSGAWQDMQNMFSGIWQGIEKILGGVLQIIWGSVQEWFGTMFNGFKGAGSNIMNALTSAVTEGASKFLSSLKSMASNALSAVKGVFGIHSPSTEFAAIGTNISLGLIQGVQGVDVASQVSDHMAGAITAMGSPTITGAVPSGDALSGSGSGGGRPLTIIFQMPDGQQMVQYLGQPLADELRVRLGLKF
jgi:phage-related protein